MNSNNPMKNTSKDQEIRPLALILSGDGLNCERETELAFQMAGAETKVVHVNELMANQTLLSKSQIFCIPGGFSFGDECGSGQILALKMKKYLGEELTRYSAEGKLILGICNGFQVLMKMGLFEEDTKNTAAQTGTARALALAPNIQGKFLNCWVEMTVNSQVKSPLMMRLERKVFQLPMRHGEGRVVSSDPSFDFRKRAAFIYKDDVNGSAMKSAALVNSAGNVLGMMPHPEAHLFRFQSPFYRGDMATPDAQSPGHGLEIFKAFVFCAKENLRRSI